MHRHVLGLLMGVSLLMSPSGAPAAENGARVAHAMLRDGSDGANWAAYGRTYGEQHYSPLDQINAANVGRLGLVWSMDLDAGNPISGPIAVNGVLYTSTGYSVIRAIDATNGKLLWAFDPKPTEKAGRKMRQGWGSRGLAWWNGKIYVGTIDGRLIALDAATGREVWSVMTVGKDDKRFITGAPRVFDGKVIIGHGGADSAATRGYVTTYDAETGKQLWRFYTVPGNPADGFEDETQAMAAKTWAGEWWKYGGGGTVWNTFTFDSETDTIFLGTGNGDPWNRRVRSADWGDNLFICSIVALDAKTGKYKWHYQTTPGETWDFNSAMDMQLGDIKIGGKLRKVIMHAPKNGFFYVLDRVTGELLAADAIAKVTWATGIDMKTGRPIEVPEARYPGGKTFDVWPSPYGAHTWLPSAFSPKSGLIYLPVTEIGETFNDSKIDPKTWRHSPVNRVDPAVTVGPAGQTKGSLLAWDPATRKEKWRVRSSGVWSGALLATGANLVFQGEADARFIAYDATTGRKLWTFHAQSPVLAPPITYSVGGRQYVTVMSGIGVSAGLSGSQLPMTVNYRTQARRILTFAIDGKAELPPKEPDSFDYVDDPTFKPVDAARAAHGRELYRSCFVCHSQIGDSGGVAPELATSTIPQSAEAFETIVRQGALVPLGMPRFEEFSNKDLEDLRQHIRAETHRVREEHRNVTPPAGN